MEKQKEAARRIQLALDELQKALHEAVHVGVHTDFMLMDSFSPPHQVPHIEKTYVVL